MPVRCVLWSDFVSEFKRFVFETNTPGKPHPKHKFLKSKGAASSAPTEKYCSVGVNLVFTLPTKLERYSIPDHQNRFRQQSLVKKQCSFSPKMISRNHRLEFEFQATRFKSNL
jgi:hypothetical protein